MDYSERSKLREAVAKVRVRIAQLKERGDSIGEQDTKAGLIEPVLSALGWRFDELEDVRREYKYRSQDNPVDYALFVLNQPRLFVEAKALGATVDRKCAGQVLGYASVAGVGWCLVTNGDEYRLYNSHAAVDADEKLFRSVRLTDADQDSFFLDTLGLIAKGAIGDSTLEALWKSQFVDRRVKLALEQVLRDEDGALAKTLHRKLPELSLPEIRESLKRADTRVNYPVVASPPPAFPLPSPLVKAPAAVAVGSAHPQPRATPRDLIDAGLIKSPFVIEATYKGERVTATVAHDGSINFAGTSYGSLSAAGGAAKAAVNGAPSDGPVPATNGWTFWQLRDPKMGQARDMDSLRQEFLAKKK